MKAYTTEENNALAKPAAGFIFDFDGVVVDSLSTHLRAWEAATTRLFGMSLVNPSRLVGYSTTSIGMLLAKEAGDPARAPELVRLKREALESQKDSVEALPGTKDLFEKLVVHNLPWCIASNANRAFITQTLATLGLDVPLVVSVEHVRNPKPAPDVFLLCATRLGISHLDHKRTIVFEDSVHGIHAAVKAGMFAVGLTTQHSDVVLRQAGAQLTCESLADVVAANWLDEPPV